MSQIIVTSRYLKSGSAKNAVKRKNYTKYIATRETVEIRSYNSKHNEANGWNNTDGSNDNYSWNCGVEGETDREDVKTLRMRMMKNAAAVLLCSRGVPMFLAGDEFGNTQFGNNNPYCQDNIISWLDWGMLRQNQQLFSFFRFLIRFRREHLPLRRHTAPCSFGFPDVSAHDVVPFTGHPAYDSHYIGILYAGYHAGRDDCIYLAVNTYWEELTVTLPKLPGSMYWYQAADTWEEDSVTEDRHAVGEQIRIKERSVKIFCAGYWYE